MPLAKVVKKIIESVGKNNSPMYTVVAIAIANSIFKPFSTLLDKKESKETKRYTALREILTECVAIPTYIGSAKFSEMFATRIKESQRAKMAKSNLSFIGVCTAAALIIPGLCTVIIKPFTDRIYGRGSDKFQPAKIENKSDTGENEVKKSIVYPQYHTCSFASFRNGELRV